MEGAPVCACICEILFLKGGGRPNTSSFKIAASLAQTLLRGFSHFVYFFRVAALFCPCRKKSWVPKSAFSLPSPSHNGGKEDTERGEWILLFLFIIFFFLALTVLFPRVKRKEEKANL